MPQTPKISVIMSVYNGEKFVAEAIDSVLRQTFGDFEFIIIDDGSTDSSLAIIKSYSDKRIKLIENEANIGLTKSLNKGIAVARGKYVARMDADDISMPKRFEKQYNFMEKNPEIGVLGGQEITFGNKRLIKTSYLLDEDIKCFAAFNNPMNHPTIFARAELLKRNPYNPDFRYSQDYELWARLLPIAKFANCKSIATAYRYHDTSVGGKNRTEQDALADKARIASLQTIIGEISPADAALHMAFSRRAPGEFDAKDILAWLRKISIKNAERKIRSKRIFNKHIIRNSALFALETKNISFIKKIFADFPIPGGAFKNAPLIFLALWDLTKQIIPAYIFSKFIKIHRIQK